MANEVVVTVKIASGEKVSSHDFEDIIHRQFLNSIREFERRFTNMDWKIDVSNAQGAVTAGNDGE